jgi:hypothetical protein
MSDDLVKRLRDKVEASRIYDDDEELLDEAADRIEKLEAALRTIIKRAEFRNSEYVTDAVCVLARTALEEKDE